MIARASVFFFLLFLESHTETGSFEKEDGRIRRLLSSFSEIILYHLEEKKKLCNVTYKREAKERETEETKTESNLLDTVRHFFECARGLVLTSLHEKTYSLKDKRSRKKCNLGFRSLENLAGQKRPLLGILFSRDGLTDFLSETNKTLLRRKEVNLSFLKDFFTLHFSSLFSIDWIQAFLPYFWKVWRDRKCSMWRSKSNWLSYRVALHF